MSATERASVTPSCLLRGRLGRAAGAAPARRLAGRGRRRARTRADGPRRRSRAHRLARPPAPRTPPELAGGLGALAITAALGGKGGHAYEVNRSRPFWRRRLTIRRPPRVRIRARKPWVRARLRFFGW